MTRLAVGKRYDHSYRTYRISEPLVLKTRLAAGERYGHSYRTYMISEPLVVNPEI
jgi:hypothetical protein